MKSFALLLVLMAVLHQTDAGNFNPSCAASDTWWDKFSKIKDEGDNLSNLSKCQYKTLGMDENYILLGGKGSSSSMTVELGSGGDGCSDGEDCMEMCQTLCCITQGCKYATLRRDENESCEIDCSIYKEEERYFICKMFSDGKWEETNDQSTCYAEEGEKSYDDCPKIARNSDFKWDEDEFNFFKSLGAIDSWGDCPGNPDSDNYIGNRRKLLSTPEIPAIPSKKDIKDAVKKGKDSGKTFKKNLIKARKSAGGKKKLLERMCDNMTCPAN